MTDTKIHGPWSFWFDSHFNSRAFIVVRPGITYRFASGPSLTAGYGHLWTDPGNDSFERDEHRPWIQVFMPFSFNDRWRLSHRLRLEYRIRQNVSEGEVIEGWSGILRWRSQTAASYWVPTKQMTRFFFQAALEILANGGKNAGPNFLDQNRVSAMVGLKHDPVTLRVGYMDRFVPGASGTAPVHEHNVVLWLNYRFRRPHSKKSKMESPEETNP